MKVGNTVTVDRRVGVDAETGAEKPPVYRVRLAYVDADGRRDVETSLDGAVGGVVFAAVEALAKADLGGRAVALGAAAAEADELSKAEVK